MPVQIKGLLEYNFFCMHSYKILLNHFQLNAGLHVMQLSELQHDFHRTVVIRNTDKKDRQMEGWTTVKEFH